MKRREQSAAKRATNGSSDPSALANPLPLFATAIMLLCNLGLFGCSAHNNSSRTAYEDAVLASDSPTLFRAPDESEAMDYDPWESFRAYVLIQLQRARSLCIEARRQGVVSSATSSGTTKSRQCV